MSIRNLAVSAALSAVAFAAVAAGTASAASYLHGFLPTGNLLPAGSTIRPVPISDLATLDTSAGALRCGDNSLGFTLQNLAASPVTATLLAFTLRDCTDTVASLTYTGCHLVSPVTNATVAPTGFQTGTFSSPNMDLRCNVAGGTTGCYYRAASATGTFTAGAVLRYTNVALTHTVPSGGTGDLGASCGTTGSLSTSFTDITINKHWTAQTTLSIHDGELHDGDNDDLLNDPTTLSARPSSDRFVWAQPAGTATCTGNTFDFTVGASGGASVDATVDNLVYGACSDNLLTFSYSACTMFPPAPTATFTATGGTGGVVALSATTLRCGVQGTNTACYHRATSSTGTYLNATQTLAFTNVAMTHNVPGGATDDLGPLCATSSTFSVNFTRVTWAATQQAVTLNTTP
jgi:hypothetical protein